VSAADAFACCMGSQCYLPPDTGEPIPACLIHCVQKKTPTHVFFYICVENG